MIRRTAERWIKSGLAGAADLIFPPACRGCTNPIEDERLLPICDECVDDYVTPFDRQCLRCAATVGPHLSRDGCVACSKDRFAFRRVYACGDYVQQLRREVLAAKEQLGQPAAVFLGKLLADRIPKDEAYDIVAPVPSHWRTRITRPFHSADVVAESLAAKLGLPYEPAAIRKVRNTPSQTSISPTQRRTNLRRAFDVRQSLDGLTILLVDDVLTTGSTTSECAKALLAKNASHVDVAVICRGTGQKQTPPRQ